MLVQERVQEVDRNGQEGKDNEDCEQDFGPWWIVSDHFGGLWRKGRKGERVRVV